MKKTYNSPTMIVVKVEQHLLDGTSLPKDDQTKISDNNDVLGRGGSGWSDDE